MASENTKAETARQRLDLRKSDQAGWLITSENTPTARDLQVCRLQRMFGLARSTAYVVAELAYAGLPR